MFKQCEWINEPTTWHTTANDLVVVTNEATDFWRDTHYGFRRHTGHFFGHAVSGGFTATLKVRSTFEALYDQAGIMVHIDEERWLKAGVEISDGEAMMSSVVTLDRSDWATGKLQADPSAFWMRVTIKAGVLRLQYSLDGAVWPLIRLCPFPDVANYRVGPMCCSPERKGLKVRFSNFAIEPPMTKHLHDLT